MLKSILFLFFIAIIGTGITAWYLLQPVNATDKNDVFFVVPNNLTAKDIGEKLVSEHLIKSAFIFQVIAKVTHLDAKLQAGDFKLSPSLTTNQIAEKLTQPAVEIWVTIPEGKRAEEVAAILQGSFPDTYRSDWEIALKQHEGYLFPDTYLFPHDVTIDTIIATMTKNFADKYATIQTNSTFTQPDAVTLASIIEREGRSPQEKQMIASVLENRLAIGMKLDVDATVQYALGYDPATQQWWRKNLSADDLKLNSHFNTYVSPGLPPHPISNPGLVSLTAVFNAPKTNYLYYYTDTRGVTHFADTLEQHEANIQKYQ